MLSQHASNLLHYADHTLPIRTAYDTDLKVEYLDVPLDFSNRPLGKPYKRAGCSHVSCTL